MGKRTRPSKEPATIQRTFGQHVRTLRTAAKMSQGELAERCGISRSYLSLIEADDINVTLGTVEAIAGVFGVTPISMLRPRRAHRTRQTR